MRLLSHRKEYDLLHYLIINRNKVLTRNQLYEHIWGNILDDQYDSNFIDVHIKNLRKKLNEHAPTPWLETVRGIGYRVSHESIKNEYDQTQDKTCIIQPAFQSGFHHCIPSFYALAH